MDSEGPSVIALSRRGCKINFPDIRVWDPRDNDGTGHAAVSAGPSLLNRNPRCFRRCHQPEYRGFSTEAPEAKTRISQLRLPSNVYVEFSGTAEAQAQSRRDLLLNSLLAGLGIVLLLSVVMGNYRNLLPVLANLPFALVGGVLAALVTGGNLSLGSLVGFVTLFGITLRNSIMLISHYEHLVEVEGMTWGLDTALRGASERLAPILMTALVTGLGLLPLAIGSGDPGREIEGPMATVILGGS